MEQALVRMDGITKRFPGVTALESVSFDILPGEVHVLLGENGAGKSTLMKILSGVYRPDEGSITICGKQFTYLTPETAKNGGISIIYQELSVIDELNIQENIFLGRLETRRRYGMRLIDNRSMEKTVRGLLEDINLKREPKTLVRDLSISEKQMVEIAKAVAFHANVIIMDEPTSSLTEEETEKLFQIIRRLRSEGKGIVYISHKLSELMKIGDRVTILKDGKYVGTHAIKDVTTDDLIRMMVGRELENKYQGVHKGTGTGKVIFSAEHITRRDGRVQDVSFYLREGEVLGFSGLIGAGRSELMEAIFGASPMKSGKITLHGRELTIKQPYDALKNGIALVTENRRETGFFPNFSIQQNLLIAYQLKKAGLGGMARLIHPQEERKIAAEQKEKLRIKCASVEQNIRQLSGGNQQKVILGKWMATDTKLVIFDEPTKGIDVGAKAEIYHLMRQLAERGVGVIVVSSEMPELLSLCDRIEVFRNGGISAEFNIEDATEERLMEAATMAEEVQ